MDQFTLILDRRQVDAVLDALEVARERADGADMPDEAEHAASVAADLLQQVHAQLD